jgi:hypothetical protein
MSKKESIYLLIHYMVFLDQQYNFLALDQALYVKLGNTEARINILSQGKCSKLPHRLSLITFPQQLSNSDDFDAYFSDDRILLSPTAIKNSISTEHRDVLKEYFSTLIQHVTNKGYITEVDKTYYFDDYSYHVRGELNECDNYTVTGNCDTTLLSRLPQLRGNLVFSIEKYMRVFG